jgi:hypothetical protein
VVSAEKDRLWVRYRTGVRNVRRASAGEDFITVPLQSGVAVEIRRSTEDEGEYQLLLTASKEVSVSAKRHAALVALAAGAIPEGATVPEGEEPFGADGAPHPAIVSNSLRDLFEEVLLELGQVSRTLALTLRWRYGVEVPLSPLVHLGAEYSLDGLQWTPAFSELKFRTKLGAIGMPLFANDASKLAELLDSRARIPTGHELLFEAQELAWTYERSALIISVAALEVGFKELVAELVPHTAWLVEHLPAPPLETLIGEYLPTLPVREHLPGSTEIEVQSGLVDAVRKAVRLRNGLIHSGSSALDTEWLDDWLRLCSSLLYAFDCYAGLDWAGQVIEEEHRVLLVDAGPLRPVLPDVPTP